MDLNCVGSLTHGLFKKINTVLYNWQRHSTSLVAQTVKHLPTMQETRVQSLGQKDLLEKEMATHSKILAWKIPWMEDPGRLQSMGSQRVGHNWVTSLSNLTIGWIQGYRIGNSERLLWRFEHTGTNPLQMPKDNFIWLFYCLVEKAMAPHSRTLAWKIPWTEEPGRLQSMGSLRVGHTERLHFHFSLSCKEKEMATHSSVLAWRIPGMGEPGGLPSMGSHRVGHDWSDLAATAWGISSLSSHIVPGSTVLSLL